MLRHLTLVIAGVVLGLATLHAHADDESAEVHVARVLDSFHDAAANADGARYFDQLTKDSIFLGTDATERWPRSAFEAFARPYFDQGKGWAYTPRERHIDVEAGGGIAWFDELLDNDAYGTCRGTGVLRKVDGRWRVAQYSLSIPIPNPLAKDVVAGIRTHTAGKAISTATVYVVRHAEKRGGYDPDLTSDGCRRACQLWRVLRSAGIDRIYATNLKRTQQTVAPTAKGSGQSVVQIDKNKTQALLKAIQRDDKAQAILVAGHSDTLAGILEGLGVKQTISIGGRFDNLYIVKLRGGATPDFQHLHYGK